MNKTSAAQEMLLDAILQLRNAEEAKAFFGDLCTVREMQDISQRFVVAAMLKEGKSYQEISKETGVSAATICRVNRCLQYGNDGYQLILNRMKEKEQEP